VTNLFTTYYNENNRERAEELRTCLIKNLNCEWISKVYVLSEIGIDKFLSQLNVNVITISRRPTYNDFIRNVNRVSGDNDINIISNSDIYFDETLNIIKDLNIKKNCFALTRWDILSDRRARLTEISGSQDCWIFQGKINHVKGEINLGVPGCDNRIAYEIEQAGYLITNPSISIKSYHLHKSNYRSNEYIWYSQNYSVGGNYKFLVPDTIYNVLKDNFKSTTFSMNLPDQLYRKKIERWYKYKKYQKRAQNSKNKVFILKTFVLYTKCFYYKIPIIKLVLILFYHKYYTNNILRN